MKLYKITISGADEHTDVKELVAFIEQYYHYKGINIELGIQVSPTKASFDSDRYRWLMKLHEQALGFCYVHLALHINPGWVEQVCAGSIPLELIEFMNLFSHHYDGGVILERIQLNFLIGREEAPDMDRLHRVIEYYNNLRFIIPYNESNKQFINDFFLKYYGYERYNCFDLLYDESHGEGKSPQQWQPAVYPLIPQGYSGGLSPDNIGQALDSIVANNKPDTKMWVDAEGKLKGDDGHLSLEKADAFMRKIQEWHQKNTQS